MKRFIFLFLTILILFSSCSTDSNDDLTITVPVFLAIETTEVPQEFTFGESYPIKVSYILPNGCYSFNDIHYEANGAERIIAVRSTLNNGEACTQATIQQEHTFTLTCNQNETYILKFWKGKDSQGKDQYSIVEVPVSN